MGGIESQPALNGQSAVFVRYRDDTGRYEMRIGNEVKSLNPANVILPKNTRVQIIGLSAKPEFNGLWGSITEIDEASGRYTVKLQGDKVLSVRYANAKAAGG